MKRRFAVIRPGPFPPANEKVAEELAARFPDHQMEIVEVLDLVKAHRSVVFGNGFPVLRHYGIDLLLRRKKLWAAFFATPFMFRAIRRLVSEHLAAGGYDFTFQIQSLFDARVEGVPHFIYSDHTHLENLTYPAFDRRGLLARAWIDLERESYQNATLNLSWSNNISRSLIEDYGCRPEQVRCVYAGCNTLAPDELPENDDYRNKNILFVGIDWERKGGPELVRAFSKVREAHPDARLTIVGSSPAVEVPGCTVVGRIPLSQLASHYKRASVFCMPTRREPFGIVFIEAMSHRLPIVGTRIGAIPDFVQDGQAGILVTPGAEQELADALIQLLNDPRRCRKLGERGREIVLERYTWERVGEAIHDAILPFLDGGGSRDPGR